MGRVTGEEKGGKAVNIQRHPNSISAWRRPRNLWEHGRRMVGIQQCHRYSHCSRCQDGMRTEGFWHTGTGLGSTLKPTGTR